MKLNEKQIEEIAEVIDDMVDDNARIRETRWDGYIALANSEKIAEELLKHYQIVDKDSVVLSKEEYVKRICREAESTVKDCKFHYEEIAIPHIVQVIKDNPNISDTEIEELIRQTGIEVKE